jgi:transcriptional regulator with XRE-family HTH domain
MFETSKLRGRIVEYYGTQRAFCKAANRSISFVSSYLSGKRFLDQRDIERWSKLLEIPHDQIFLYFFTLKVHETEEDTQNMRVNAS